MEDIKKNFSFSVKHQNKNYRVGLIQTHRGEIDTPAFMPVGTQATVKGVFIEKPISHTLEGIDDMVQVIASKKPVTFVGYNLQFHPIVKKIKEIIHSGELGAPIALQAYVGQWLPNWHPDEDWKSLYVAKAELGGGALLSLIHEVEMALSWFGEAIDVKAYFPENEKLNIDVDVAANLMLSHHSGAVSQLHFDVLQDPTGRGGVVLFEEGRLQYDFIQNEIILISKDHPKGISLYKDMSYDTNKCYKEMMQQFLNVVAQRRYRHEHDFVNGVSSLKVAASSISIQGPKSDLSTMIPLTNVAEVPALKCTSSPCFSVFPIIRKLDIVGLDLGVASFALPLLSNSIPLSGLLFEAVAGSGVF